MDHAGDSLDKKKPTLARSLGFGALLIYGIGDILGAGIYALLGKVAAIGGTDSWMAFALALTVAFITGLSYAELGSRYPKSGGAASFCFETFHLPIFSLLVGWMVLWSGMVSMATISQAFSNQILSWFPEASLILVILLFLLFLGLINFWGINYTSLINMLFTAIEVSGLLIVVYAALAYLSGNYPSDTHNLSNTSDVLWTNIFFAAGIAFFAFIGFEDMVNIAEEVKNPQVNLPRAILSAIAITGCFYVAISYLAVRVVSPEELGASHTPLLDIVKRGLPAFPLILFSFIALFAMANTALLNFVMGSRLLYGMAEEKIAPAFLMKIHPSRRTPYLAIITIFCIVAPVAAFFDLVRLAATTSALILMIFTIVHLSLIVTKWRKLPFSGFKIPAIFPVVGIASTLFLLFHLPVESLLGALMIITIGFALIAGYRYFDRMHTTPK